MVCSDASRCIEGCNLSGEKYIHYLVYVRRDEIVVWTVRVAGHLMAAADTAAAALFGAAKSQSREVRCQSRRRLHEIGGQPL